ncbi:MAG: SLBB domain-containing protein [Prevotella sp.]|nr:SLBB domain-containing protein [Prevotella sp.]
MRKIFFILALALFSMAPAHIQAQTGMTDQQLITFILQERDKGSSQNEIITKLIQRGVDIQQIQRVKRRYEQQIKNAGLGMVAEESMEQVSSRMRVNNGQERKDNGVSSNTKLRGEIQLRKNYSPNDPEFIAYQNELGDLLPTDSLAMLREILRAEQSNQNKIFGHDLFNNENLTFEPNMNIATPKDYVLGPGDAVIVDVYGASQESFHETVSPDGFITIQGFGPIQIGGMSVSQASSYLRSQLGARYSSSQIRLSVGQTRSITVNIAGEVNAPGTYTMSAFSTVFNALYMAGGISDLGTLRNIKVYRNNRLISTVDVYDYILNGKATGNVKLTDNDMIIVESYDCLVSITGRVKRPMYYEMKQGESLNSLIKYSGGFASDAYRGSVRVLRKNGALRSVHTVGEFDMGTFQMADGDSVTVDSILNRYQNMAEVIGAVFRPGKYNIGGDITSVRSLIESAQGVTEDAFTTHAVMHRMRPDRTLEVLSVDLAGILDGRVSDVVLQNEDVLFVPTKREYIENQTITITGEVQSPGIYKYAANETLEDFILQAGGLTESASTAKVEVARRIVNPSATQSSDTIAYLYSFDLKDGFVVGEGNSAFHLEPFDCVYVRRSPGYMDQRGVTVEGEVLFEGGYTLSKRSERLSEVINRAGGLTKTAYAPGARLIRKRTADELARKEAILEAAKRSSKNAKDSIDISSLDLGPTYDVGIELNKALANPGCDADIVLRAGDRIVVPEYSGTVKINGEVMYPNTVSYVEGKDLEYYINQAGGWSDNSKKKKTYIIYMNGTVAKADRKHKPMPGCEIVVPTKQRGHKLSTAELLAIGTSTASIATMIATIVNVLK